MGNSPSLPGIKVKPFFNPDASLITNEKCSFHEMGIYTYRKKYKKTICLT
jgi:hypothetical protein